VVGRILSLPPAAEPGRWITAHIHLLEPTVRIAGIILIVLGVVGLAYGGITYTRRQDTVSIGPISATVNQRETLPISPIAGAVALAAGIGLLMAGSRRRA
jgi:hypothetical protein